MTTKNVIICGPSAAGKDTVARALYFYWQKDKNPNLVISNTTRPMRKKEWQDTNYHFCTDEEEFDNYDYLEQTIFRGWKYGIPFQSIKEDKTNILILNPEGVFNAIEKLNNYEIFYLHRNLFVRLFRSVKREGRFKFEMIRRSITDIFDFWKFKQTCKKEKIQYHNIKNVDSALTIKEINDLTK